MAAFLSIHTHTHSGIVHDAVFKLLKRACGIHTTLTAERISADDRHFFKNNNFLALLSGHDGGREAGAAGTDDVPRADPPNSDAGWIDYDADLHVWKNLGVHEVWRRYVDAWCAACASSLDFDVMAHPDLPMRFANEGLAPDFDLAPLWDQMAACAHDTHRRIEVSTAGMRKSVNDYYPTRGLLECFAHADVPIVFGSDAHRACDICWGIRDAYAFAYSCGYRSFDIPRDAGAWETVSL